MGLTLLLLAGISNVSAETIKEVNNESALKNCISTNGNTCKLTSNFEVTETIIINNNVNIDLSGYQITSSIATTFKLNTGSLTVKDTSSDSNGKIEVSGEVFQIGTKGNTTDNKDTAVLTIEEGVDIISTNDSCVVIYAGTLNTNGNLTTKDGTYSTITGSGKDAGTVINITGGKVSHAKDLAVYNPQDGILNITGGEIIGTTGVEIRAGSLNITGGIITGTGVPSNSTSNTNGSTTFGAGVAIAQHTTQLVTSATITGGTIQGYTPLYQSDPQQNIDKDANNANKILLNITGGTFKVTNNGNKGTVYSENNLSFITGGTYSTDVTNYVKTGYECTKVGENYVVSKINNETNVPTVKPNTDKIEEVTIGVVGETNKTEEVLLDSLENAELNLNEKVEVALEINKLNISNLEEKVITEMEKAVGNAKIDSYFDITVAVRNFNDGTLIGTLPVLTEEIELMILLPENLRNTNKDINRVYYIVRNHDGKIEKIATQLSKDEKYLVFKTNKFSTYALAYEDIESKEELPPKTLDNTSLYFIIGLISLVSIFGIIKNANKIFN